MTHWTSLCAMVLLGACGLSASAETTSLVVGPPATGAAPALFAAGYETADGSGWLTGYLLRDGKTTGDGLWGGPPARSAADLMDAQAGDWPDRRLVLSAHLSSGIPWEWEALSEGQQQALETVDGRRDTGPAAELLGRQRLAYLRGDRSHEQAAMPPGPFRTRASRLGAIVNSRPWLAPGPPSGNHPGDSYRAFQARNLERPSMLYVGANDGMLHGFDAATGQEKIAYVPEGVHDRIAGLTRPARSFTYLVDGSPLVGDLSVGTSDAPWRSYLAGFLGAGGRGYFVLDVTAPQHFPASEATRVVVLDHSADAGLDPDIGRIRGEPVLEAGAAATSRQITRLNDGRWALVTGNGDGSAHGRAVLLIQYLDGARELRKIPTDGAVGNGLAAPRLVDLDGDGIPDVAYAGDLLGRFWKFDLGADRAAAWRVSFGGRPFFTARDGAGRPQPITVAPVWKAHPKGGLMLAFGTGRNFEAADRLDAHVQSLYGLHDDTPVRRGVTPRPGEGGGVTPRPGEDGGGAPRPGEGSGPIGDRSQLASRRIEAVPGHHALGIVRATGAEAARRGWFIDLPLARERVLQNPGWFEGDLVDIWSVVPSPDLDQRASGAGRRYRLTVDLFTGSAPNSPIYAPAPVMSGGQPSRIEAGPSATLHQAGRNVEVTAPGLPPPPERLPLGRIIRRPSWRQLQ